MTLRIYCAPSYGRTLEVPHHFCVLQLLRVPGLTYEPQTNDALIERSRSIAASKCLRGDYDVLLTIDSDIIFRVTDAVRICMQAVEHNAIVGGVYVTRDRDDCRPTSDWDGAIDFTGVVGKDDTPCEVKAVANGFMAVPTPILAAIASQDDMPLCHEDRDGGFWPLYQCYPVQNEAGKWIFLSEDFALCHRARAQGFKCLINPAVRVHHYGMHPFRLEDMLQKPLPTQPMTITGSVRPETGRPGWHIESWATEAEDAPSEASGLDHAALLVGSNGEPLQREAAARNGQPVLVMPASRRNGMVN